MRIKRIDKELTRAVVRELGTQRVKQNLCFQSDTGVTHIRNLGCPVPYMRLFFYKYPNLLAWKDFKITNEEILLQHIIQEN